MSEQRFATLRRRLVEAGTPASVTRRLLRELRDHCADIEADLVFAGATPREAAAEARRRIGGDDALFEQVASRPLLQSFTQRMLPGLAVARGRAVFALLPGLVDDCRSGGVVRWGAAAGASAGVTLTIFLALQLAIAAG